MLNDKTGDMVLVGDLVAFPNPLGDPDFSIGRVAFIHAPSGKVLIEVMRYPYKSETATTNSILISASNCFVKHKKEGDENAY